MTRLAEISGLLADAEADLNGSTSGQSFALSLGEHRAQLFAPLRVAVAGRVKAGKSTLLNALVGERLAPTDAGECTKVVTWYRHGATYQVIGVQGPIERSLVFDRTNGQLTIDLGGDEPTAFDRLDVTWPSEQLTGMTLIDTPGIDSVNRQFSDRSTALLSSDTAVSGSAQVRPDAVIYLMTHAHERDVAMLDSFADNSIVGAGLTNAIGVLSRADEIGVGSRDTMTIAEAVAESYGSDPRLAARCQAVLPFAGLLAETAVTLREEEYRKLSSIAAIEPRDLQLALLSVDRFVSTPLIGMPSQAERIELLDRFGAYGVRLCCQLIAQGQAPDSTALASSLREHSGLTRLRSTIESRFGHRSGLLRRQAALAALAAAVPHYSVAMQDRVTTFIDRSAANDHEQSEVAALRSLAMNRDTTATDAAIAARAERILGGEGPSPHERLGLSSDADSGEIDRAARLEHGYWSTIEHQPGARLAIRTLARVAQRSCEALLTS